MVDPQRIVRTARAMADFDVLCLQEIASGFDAIPGHPGDQPAQLAACLPGFQVFFGAAVHDISPDGRAQRFGNLVATRLQAAHVQHHPLPWPADPDSPSMPRICTVVTVQAPGLGPVRVMTTHLEFRSAAQRLAQAHAVGRLHAEACTQAMAPLRVIEGETSPARERIHTRQATLCGDFNWPPGWSGWAWIWPRETPIISPCSSCCDSSRCGSARGFRPAPGTSARKPRPWPTANAGPTGD